MDTTPNTVEEEGGGGVDPDAVAKRMARLEALGQSLSRTRKEAIDGRLACGIEAEWAEDEEHYEGIDDLNRGESRTAWQSKPPGQTHPGTDHNTSTVFPNITRPYVDAAAAKVGDILLPTDDRPWSLTNTPIADLEDRARGKLPEDVTQGMAAAKIPPEQQQQVVAVEADEATKAINKAKETAKLAEKRIEDWMVEGQWHAEMRLVMDDVARIGSGVIKGPIPHKRKSMMWKDGALVVEEKVVPISRRIDPRDFYPDPGCGENIHDGSYTWERDRITKKALFDLTSDPSYIASQIMLCLSEGPNQPHETRKLADGLAIPDKDLFEIWYFHGFAEREDMEAAGCDCGERTVFIPALIVMVNDHVIKATLNPLDTGEFPYDVMPWQRRKNLPWGLGVARQIRTPQRIIVGATRAMLTNAGRAGGPIIVSVDGLVYPKDGSPDVTPWKQYGCAEGTEDVRNAFHIFTIPSLQAEFTAIIQFGLKLAEDVTGLPLLLQGQAGSAPETLGGQQLVDRNASGVLRRIARTMDDRITEPHVRRYYAWLLQHGEDAEKGDFVIDARGSTSLVEREIYKGEVNALLQASITPAFGLDPELVMAEHLRVEKKDPKNFQLSEEKKKAMAAAQQQGGGNPALEVANVRKETELAKVEANKEFSVAEFEFRAAESEKQRKHDLQMAEIQRDIKVIEFAEKRGMKLMDVKKEIGKTVLTLRSQEKMGGTNVAEPVVEPKGVAPEGQAFAK